MFYVLYFEYSVKDLFHKILCNCRNNIIFRTYGSFACKRFERSCDFPKETFVNIGRKLSQEDIFYTENNDYVILHKKKLN